MLGSVSACHEVAGSESEDTVDLLWLCVANREDHSAWSEFLRRILPKLRYFIRSTICQSAFGFRFSKVSSLVAGEGVDDLIQSTLVRLIENDCSLLKRFWGRTENDLFAYLAVISRSVVHDCWRRQHALKRNRPQISHSRRFHMVTTHPRSCPAYTAREREILAGEVLGLANRALDVADCFSERNRLIFKLHFFDDLSAAQIVQCRGIGLSKGGVERVLSRVKERIKELANARPLKVAVR